MRHNNLKGRDDLNKLGKTCFWTVTNVLWWTIWGEKNVYCQQIINIFEKTVIRVIASMMSLDAILSAA